MATRALQQYLYYMAWNTSTNAYVTGDAANHTLYWIKDHVASAAGGTATEVDGTHLPGLYYCLMSSTETDCIEGCLGGKSATANVVLIPTMVAFDYLNTSAPATAGVPDVNVKNYNNGAVSTAATGIPKVDIDTIKTNAVVNAGTVTFPTSATLASTTNITAGTITTVTTVTNQLTAAQIATGIWQDATAGDFTTASSIGKSLYTTGNAPGAASGLALVGSNMGTASSVTGAVGSVTGNVGGNVVGSVNSVNAGVTVSTNADKTGYSVSTVGDKAGYSITSNIKKNQALNNFQFLMTDSTLHAPATGLTVTVTRSIDGAAFAAGTLSAVTEISNGMYAVNFGAGDLNGSVIVLQATAAASDTTFERIVSQP